MLRLRVPAFSAVLFLLLSCTFLGCAGNSDDPPKITQVTQLADTDNDQKPYTVWATVTSAHTVTHVRLYYARPTDPQFLVADMNSIGENTYQADIPPQARGTTVRYFVWASDGTGIATYPQDTMPPNY